MPPKLTKVCPYCGETCEGYYPNNLICECGAKYYAKTGTWLERKKKKENADLVEVVRCKDCKWWEARAYGSTIGRCENPRNGLRDEYADDTDYCSYGERREDTE